MRKRSREMKIRLTDEEYNQIEESAKELGLTKQAYVLGAVDDAVIIPADALRELCMRFAECNRQLRGMATNVNQMAHIANIYNADKDKKLPEEYLLIDIYEKIDDYRKESEKAWQSIRSLLSLQKNMQD